MRCHPVGVPPDILVLIQFQLTPNAQSRNDQASDNPSHIRSAASVLMMPTVMKISYACQALPKLQISWEKSNIIIILNYQDLI